MDSMPEEGKVIPADLTGPRSSPTHPDDLGDWTVTLNVHGDTEDPKHFQIDVPFDSDSNDTHSPNPSSMMPVTADTPTSPADDTCVFDHVTVAIKSEVFSDEDHLDFPGSSNAIFRNDNFIPSHQHSLKVDCDLSTQPSVPTLFGNVTDEGPKESDSTSDIDVHLEMTCESCPDDQSFLNGESEILESQSPSYTHHPDGSIKSEIVCTTPEEILSHDYIPSEVEDCHSNSTNLEVKSEVLYDADNESKTEPLYSCVNDSPCNEDVYVKSEIKSEYEWDVRSAPTSPTIEIDRVKSEGGGFPTVHVSFGDVTVSHSQPANGDRKHLLSGHPDVWQSDSVYDNDELAPVDRLVSQAFSSPLNPQHHHMTGQSKPQTCPVSNGTRASHTDSNKINSSSNNNINGTVLEKCQTRQHRQASTDGGKGRGKFPKKASNRRKVAKEHDGFVGQSKWLPSVVGPGVKSQSGLTTFNCSMCGKDCKFYFCLHLPATNQKVEITYKCPSCVRVTNQQVGGSGDGAAANGSASTRSSKKRKCSGLGKYSWCNDSSSDSNDISSDSADYSDGGDSSSRTTTKTHNTFSNVITTSGHVTQSYKCLDCQKQFRNTWELKCHAAVHHGPKDKVYTCPVCDKGYTTSLGFQEHMKVHLPVVSPSPV